VIAARGLKRVGAGVAAVIAAAIGAFALVPVFIPADHVRDVVKAEIRAVTGLDPVARGAVVVSLFPSPTISFTDVVLGDERPGEPALSAERLTAQLRLLPLFTGRIEIADVSLVRPRIAVTFEPDGRSNWSALIDTLSRTLKPGAQRADRLVSFSEIRIAEGTIAVRDDARGISETLNDVNLSLAWPAISTSFGAAGRFVWRGEPVDASISLNDLFATLSGDRSGLKFRIAGALAKLGFDGHIMRQPALKIEGTLAADGPSMRDVVRWAGRTPLPGGGFGRFALKAQTSMVGATIALWNVNAELDGNSAEGVLTFAGEGRPTLQGTLAVDDLDISPYVSTVRLLRQDEHDWNRGNIGLDGLAAFDLDVRLSAARISLNGAKFGRTAITTNLRSGRMTITVSESQAFGGTLKGTLALTKMDSGADLKAQLQFADVNLEPCLGELFGIRRLEGKGDLTFSIEGAGQSVFALTRTLNGEVRLAARQGQLSGLNVEQLLRRLDRRPLSGGVEFRSGTTPFDKLRVALKIAQGTATMEDVYLEGPAVKLALGGSASIPARDLDLKGTASLVRTATAGGSDAFDLPFVVQGPWDDPIMLPDAEILLRRSRATAPLLDAIKDRKARDAVRSVVEQLRGSSAPVAPGGAAAATGDPKAATAAAPAVVEPAATSTPPAR
jgi:AsmA protein